MIKGQVVWSLEKLKLGVYLTLCKINSRWIKALYKKYCILKKLELDNALILW